MAAFLLKMVGLNLITKLSAGGKERLSGELEKRMRLILEEAIGAVQEHIQGKRVSNPDDLLGVVSGRLRQAIGGPQVTRTADGIVGSFGPQRVVYAAVHEFGDPDRNIRPRPFLSTGLADMKERIEEELGAAFKASVLTQ